MGHGYSQPAKQGDAREMLDDHVCFLQMLVNSGSGLHLRAHRRRWMGGNRGWHTEGTTLSR